jgi:hypothetical protein
MGGGPLLSRSLPEGGRNLRLRLLRCARYRAISLYTCSPIWFCFPPPLSPISVDSAWNNFGMRAASAQAVGLSAPCLNSDQGTLRGAEDFGPVSPAELDRPPGASKARPYGAPHGLQGKAAPGAGCPRLSGLRPLPSRVIPLPAPALPAARPRAVAGPHRGPAGAASHTEGETP